MARPPRGLLLLAPLALALGAFPASAEPTPSPPSSLMKVGFDRTTLDNGLELIVHEDHRTPVVAVNLWYHVGSKDEAPGKSGFAHLFEHMMFHGSRHVEPGMFLSYLDAVGATDRNATTNTDRTSYFETVPRGRLELALWLESDRMAFLLDKLDQKALDTEREVVKNERREKYENVPYGLVPQFIRAALFPPGHPYRSLTIGSPEDLDAATLDDVRGFFKTFYAPSNATLVVAGDLDPVAARSLVERYFGPIPRGSTQPRRVEPPPVRLEGEKRLGVEAGVELSRLYVSWPSPAVLSAGDAELEALARVLANGKSSRLYRRLVHDTGLAQAVAARQAAAQLGGVFEIVLTLRPGASPDDALSAIDDELGKLRANAPSDEELGRARARLITDLVLQNERISSRANALNAYHQLAGDAGFLDRDIGRFRGLSGEAVRRAVEAHLPAKGRVVTVVKPSRGAPQAGALREGP